MQALPLSQQVLGLQCWYLATPNASQKTLRILQWHHFVPEYDAWFNNVYVKEWGEKHDTKVIVDNVGMTSLNGRAEAEISAQKGHDLCMFLLPPPTYEDHVIDHREVYEECEHRYGKAIDLAIKSTYNPKTKKILWLLRELCPGSGELPEGSVG